MVDILTGIPADTSPLAQWGLFCYAHVPDQEIAPPIPGPNPTPILGGDWEPPWKRKKQPGLKKDDDDDIMAMMITLLGDD